MSAAVSTGIGAAVSRIEGRAKVTGAAQYAYEYRRHEVAYCALVQATIARGAVEQLDDTAAREISGVIDVLWHGNAPRLADTGDGELAVMQSNRVAYRGQIVAAVIGDSQEAADEAAHRVEIAYRSEQAHVQLDPSDPGLYAPEKVNPNFPTDTSDGDVDAALAAAAVRLDEVYTTPAEHNNPMEPHASLALWDDGDLTMYDSTQGVGGVRDTLATAFGLPPERVRVISPHVGGGFGSKGTPRPHLIVAAMAASVVGRPVKAAATRRQMFAFVGYRTPTIQRVQLGCDESGHLTAIAHDVIEQTSTVREFAEQTAVVTRMMYAAPNRRTTHRLAALDVPTPSWMRAPGECPGMFALESAMDELALAAGLDPIELRIRNEPEVDPESGLPFSSRGLVACLRQGAELFGWDELAARRSDPWDRHATGVGVAASTYPARWRPSQASVEAEPDGVHVVRIAAADIGTGARTALAQVAADLLDVPLESVRLELGDSTLPAAPLAGGSMGTASWANAIAAAVESLRQGGGGSGDTEDTAGPNPRYSTHAFGAQFAEVRVDTDTGEVRVPRLLGVFGAGRIVNPKTARSQLIGGMTMGLGMALMEESLIDAAHGDYLNRDLAQYHVPVNADCPSIEASWIDEEDHEVNPLGIKGIGEIGIVGTAAAIANAVHHATGVRVRALPIRPDRVLDGLSRR